MNTDIIEIINSGDLHFESVLSFFVKAYDDLKKGKNLNKYIEISKKAKKQLLANCEGIVRTFIVNSDSLKTFKSALVSLKTFEERGNFKYSGFDVEEDVIEEDDRKLNYDNNYNLKVSLINKESNKKTPLDDVLKMDIDSAKDAFLHQDYETDDSKKTKYYINYSLNGFYVNSNNEYADHLGMFYELFDDLSRTTEENNIFEKHLKEKFYKIFLSKYRERDIFDTIDGLDIVRKPGGEYSKFFNPYDSPNGSTGNIGSRNVLDTFKVKVDKHMYDDIKFCFEKIIIDKEGKELNFCFRISTLLHTLPSDILYYKKLSGNTDDKIVLKETIKESIKTIKPYIQFRTSEGGYVTVSFYSNSKYTGNYRVDDVSINNDFLNVRIKIGDEERALLESRKVYESFKSGSVDNTGFCYFKFVDLKVGDNVLNTSITSEILTHEVKNEAGKVISTFKDYDSIMYDKEVCVEFNYNKLLLLTPDNDDSYYNEFVTGDETNYLLNVFEENKVADSAVTDETPRALIGSYCDTSLFYKDGKLYLDCTNFGLHNCINFIDWIKILDIDYFDKYHWQKYFNQEYEFYTNGVIEQYSTEDGYLLFNDSSSVSDEILTVPSGSISDETLSVGAEYVKDRSSNKNMYLILEPANSKAKEFIEIGFNIYDLEYQADASINEELGTRQVVITSFLSQDANSWRAHRKVVS